VSVTTSIDLQADPTAVWAVLSDLGNLGSWVSNHAGYVGAAPGALAPGTEYTERIRVLGMPNDVAWTVSALEDGRRIAQEGRGPMGISIDAEYTVEPAGDGSRLTVSQTFSGAALFAVKGQLEREVKGAQESSLAKLRELVESA
jgi:carbon monoxide dehydrogenase subunit G